RRTGGQGQTPPPQGFLSEIQSKSTPNADRRSRGIESRAHDLKLTIHCWKRTSNKKSTLAKYPWCKLPRSVIATIRQIVYLHEELKPRQYLITRSQIDQSIS